MNAVVTQTPNDTKQLKKRICLAHDSHMNITKEKQNVLQKINSRIQRSIQKQRFIILKITGENCAKYSSEMKTLFNMVLKNIMTFGNS